MNPTHQSPAAPTSSPDLDLSVLDMLARHDHDKIRRYAMLFVQSMQDVLGQIDEALACGDLARLGSMGHRAKSTARAIGGFGLSHQCLLMEQAAQAHNAPAARAIAVALRPLFSDIHQALLQRLATPSLCPATLTNLIDRPASPTPPPT